MLCIACFKDGLKETVSRYSKKEKEDNRSWRSPSSNSDSRSSIEPSTRNECPTDTEYIWNWHRNQKLNQWDVEKMKNALEEWCYWEDRRVKMGLKHLDMSKAQIAKRYGLSPSTFWNHMLGKVQGYEHCSGGARQPRVLSAM